MHCLWLTLSSPKLFGLGLLNLFWNCCTLIASRIKQINCKYRRRPTRFQNPRLLGRMQKLASTLLTRAYMLMISQPGCRSQRTSCAWTSRARSMGGTHSTHAETSLADKESSNQGHETHTDYTFERSSRFATTQIFASHCKAWHCRYRSNCEQRGKLLHHKVNEVICAKSCMAANCREVNPQS